MTSFGYNVLGFGSSANAGTLMTFGAEDVFEESYSQYLSIDRLSATTAIAGYKDSSNNGRCVILTVDGTSISAGDPVTFTTSATKDIDVVALSASKALVVYTGADGFARVVSISGTTPSYGTEFSFTNSEIWAVAGSKLTASTVMVGYTDKTNSERFDAVVLSCPNTTVSAGTIVNLDAGATSGDVGCVALTSTLAMCVYTDEGNNNYGTATAMTISGTTITKGTPVVFDSDGGAAQIAAAPLTATTAVVTYARGGVKARVLTVADATTVSAGSALSYLTGTPSGNKIARVSDTTAVTISNNANYYGTAYILTISGTNVTGASAATSYNDEGQSGPNGSVPDGDIIMLSDTVGAIAFQDYHGASSAARYGTSIAFELG